MLLKSSGSKWVYRLNVLEECGLTSWESDLGKHIFGILKKYQFNETYLYILFIAKMIQIF